MSAAKCFALSGQSSPYTIMLFILQASFCFEHCYLWFLLPSADLLIILLIVTTDLLLKETPIKGNPFMLA